MRLSEITILALHTLCLGFLVLYGVHRLWLVWLLRRHGPASLDHPPFAPADPDRDPPRGDLPVVTVQLPLYNEPAVAARLLRAVAALDWPRDRLEIQVLDDSTDATRRLAAAGVRGMRRRGLDAHHLHRSRRTGYKAGALEAGRRRARGELLAVFDADFVPPPDFLRRVVPAFDAPDIGMVQARWDHLNPDENLLTGSQAVLLDGHFAVEHAARSASGRFFNFNGTAGVWRRQCLEDGGGWSARTLTEDLDLSYRAQLAGWRFRYLPQVRVPAELPSRMADFKGQQDRWARGSVQTCRLLLPRILGGTLPLKVRLEALVHLTANFCYPAMLLLALLLFPSQEIRHRHGLWALAWLDAGFLGAGLLSLAAFYGRASGWAGVARVPTVIAVGVGLCVSNTVAVVRGLFEDGGTFRRTPKRGWRARLGSGTLTPAVVGELALGCYLAAAAATALVLGLWPAVPFLALFASGLLAAGIFSALPGTLAALSRPLRPHPRERPAGPSPSGLLTRR